MFILIKLTYFFLATLVALHSTLVGRSHAGSEFQISVASRFVSLFKECNGFAG